MKIKCIANTGEDLLQTTIMAGQLRTTKYSIEIGKQYIVYSIASWKGYLKYLLSESQEDSPSWYPSELFEIINSKIPPIWYFIYKKYQNFETQEFICGYKEMVLNDKHYEDLIEWESDALKVFYKRKEEIDEFEDPEIKKPISENSYY